MHELQQIEQIARTQHPHPMSEPSPLSKEEKIDAIAHYFRNILEILELDLSHPSLERTPERFARMYIQELFWGLDHNAFPDISYLDNEMMPAAEGVVSVKEIPIKSMCEHHFVPIIGTASISYVPKERILGLSKINRVVDYFCRRPQLQERLTAQIADALSLLLETDDVSVSVEAEHFCVTLRGIEHPTSRTFTQVARGRFKMV